MSSTTMTLAALGRPFQPGMLYDCRNDHLIPGITLWNKEELENNLHHVAKQSANLSIMTSDSIQDKANALNISAELKLSVLGGLVSLSGAGHFLQDHKCNSQTSRVTLSYQTTSNFKSLSMDHLGKPGYSQVFEHGTATHVCTGVEYGADVFLVFEKTSHEESSNKKIHGELEAAVKTLKFSVSGMATVDIKEVDNSQNENISCKFFGDVHLDKIPTNYSEAKQILTELPKLIVSVNIPKKVHLYPLEKLDTSAAKLVRSISESIISKVQDVIQSYINLMSEVNSLSEKPIVKEISFLEDDLSQLRSTAELSSSMFKQDILPILPEIRGGGKEEHVLADILNNWLKSSFSPGDLQKCLKVIKGHVTILQQYTAEARKKDIPVHFNDSINDFAGIDKVVVAFKFNNNALVSHTLVQAKHKLENKDFTSDSTSKEKSAKPKAKGMLHATFSVFCQYFEQNHSSENIKYAISNGNECPDDDLAFIELYEYGSSDIFCLPGRPGTPVCDDESVTTSSVKVSWKPSEDGKVNIMNYKVVVFEEGSDRGIEINDISETLYSIQKLHPGKKYSFQVHAVSLAGNSHPSDKSRAILTDSEERLAFKILQQSKQVADTNKSLAIYTPNRSTNGPNRSRGTVKVNRIYIGDRPNGMYQKELTIMVVGATGTGKTTFLNSMINYTCDVRQEDDFRFKIITQEAEGAESATSRTKTVTAYTMYQTKLKDDHKVPYIVTVIDTPGYGDTEGLAADKQTTGLIKELFESQPPNGINTLTAVCLVVKASDTRLTAHQRHNFKSVLQLFGKDLAKNFVIISTFCDAAEPPVQKTLEAANIKFRKLFKFNNSAFFEGQKETKFQRAHQDMFWELGQNSFDDFFTEIGLIPSVSLQQSAEVLRRRENLEHLVGQLHQTVQLGMGHLDTMRQEGMIMEKFEAQIKANEKFTFVTTEPQVYTEKISNAGQNTTTCMTCNSTCHESCAFANDSDKRNCCAMDGDYCTNCPGKCRWDLHRNAPYIYRIRNVKVTKTNEDLKKKYGAAQADMNTKENMMDSLGQQFGNKQMQICGIIKNINDSINELKRIAQEPSYLTDVQYIDILIREEQMEPRPGWEQRMKALQIQRDIAIKIKEAQNPNYDPFEQYKAEPGGWRKYAKKVSNFFGL